MTIENAQKTPRTPSATRHTFRTRDDKTKTMKYGRKQAILLWCTECLGWETHPDDCTSHLCPLFPFRGQTMESQRGTK